MTARPQAGRDEQTADAGLRSVLLQRDRGIRVEAPQGATHAKLASADRAPS
jgi:hypothetical protein